MSLGIILVMLILLAVVFGFRGNPNGYYGGGFLLLVLIILWATGHLTGSIH